MVKRNIVHGTEVPEELVTPMVRLCAKYVQFCKSPFNSEPELRESFWKLCGQPMLQAISFSHDGSLLLGIKEIILTDKETDLRHYLGEYIVTLTRKPEKKIAFECMTPLFTYSDTGITSHYHHPHISASRLCMLTGLNEMYMALAQGNILEVYDFVIKILNTVDEVPFYPAALKNWPLAKEKKHVPESLKASKPVRSRFLSLPDTFGWGRGSGERSSSDAD